MTRIDTLSRWYLARGSVFRSTVKSAGAFVALYGGAIVEQQVSLISAEGFWPRTWGHAAVLFFLVVGLGIVFHSIQIVLQRQELAEQKRRETLLYASSAADRHTAALARAVDQVFDRVASLDRAGLLKAVIGSQERLDLIVDGVYQLFEARYGESEKIYGRIDFEVTFMTKSYRDGKITICAAANRHGRTPLSMTKRASSDPDIYDNTVTAELFREDAPSLRIVPDTIAAVPKYSELYPQQRRRIRSSVIYPVLSPRSLIIGTLVVHCNRPEFFKHDDAKYWEELLEAFAKRLALEKLKLDVLHDARTSALLESESIAPF